MFCSEVERLKDEMVLRSSEGNISNIFVCWRWNLLTHSFTATISSGSSLVDLRLCVSVKRLMSGISQQGAGSQSPAGFSCSFCWVYCEKGAFLKEKDMVAAHANTSGIFFWITFQTYGTGRNWAFHSDVEVWIIQRHFKTKIGGNGS